MEAYTGFAQVYDLFMDDVPYVTWKEHIVKQLRQAGIHDGLICELGCGTGKMTRLLAESGYDMIGIDASDEMLSIARESGGRDILYLNQDIRSFELYGTVRAVVSVCDTMNYLLEKEDLLKVFRLVNNYLDPGGLFLFDLNTEYKFRELMGERVFFDDRPQGSLVWDNYYDKAQKINEYRLTLFIRQRQGLYQKYEEVHYERAYSLKDVIGLLEQSGMRFVQAYDADTLGPVGEDCGRVYVLARECGKKSYRL